MARIKGVRDLEFGKRLTTLRKSKGLSRARMSELVGIGVSTLQSYEEGRSPQGTALKQLSEFFDCPVDYLLGTKYGDLQEGRQKYQVIEPSPDAFLNYDDDSLSLLPTAITVLGQDGAPKIIDTKKYNIAFRSGWLSLFGAIDDLVLIEINDDHMSPQLLPGDIAILSKGTKHISSGSILAIGIDNTIVFRYIDLGPDVWFLRPSNPIYPPLDVRGSDRDKVKIIGKLVWVSRKLR